MTKLKSRTNKGVRNLKNGVKRILFNIGKFRTRKATLCKNNNHKIRNTNGECINCSYVREGYREEDFVKNFPKYYKKKQ